MVSGEHRRQKSSPLVGAQTGWRRTALTCCVVGIMCVSVLLMHAARRTELSVAGHGSLRSRGKKGVRGRGGAVDAGLSAAAALKEKARREDSQSRRLRMQANKDYDAAHEMMRKAGVLAQSVARTSKKEGALRALVVQDKRQIAADKRSLTRVGLLKKEIAKMRMRVGKELKRKKLAETTVALARKRLVRDEGRLGDQRTNVGKLLRDASQFADEAETSLKKSQVLRLNSLSSKNTRDTSAASTDFEDAGHEQRKSKTMTRKALDYRSRARLGQEYVLMLSKMVKRDRTSHKLDRAAAHLARHAYSAGEKQLTELKRKAAEHSEASLQADEEVRKNAEARTTSKISRLQTLVHKDDRRAKSEQHRAMRLLHMSHKLQAQAAQLLDDSTHDIMLEESEA